MARFQAENEELYIDGQKVLKAWESWNGWYWFATRDYGRQDSIIEGRVIEDDQIWFGYVQGQYEEWGAFSQGELQLDLSNSRFEGAILVAVAIPQSILSPDHSQDLIL